MKKTFRAVNIILAGAYFTACTQADITNTTPTVEQCELTVAAPAQTKVSFTEGEHAIELQWELNDVATIYDEQGDLVGDYLVSKISEDGLNATFTGDVLSDGSYTFVYPRSDSETLAQRNLESLAQQSQDAASLDHLDLNCRMKDDFILGETITPVHEMTIVTIKVLSKDGAAPSSLNFTDGGNEYSVALSNLTPAGGVYTFSMMIKPNKGARTLKFETTYAGGATDSIEIPTSKECIAGMRYTSDLTAGRVSDEFVLADFTASSAAPASDIWVITDSAITTASLANLRALLSDDARMGARLVSVEFKNFVDNGAIDGADDGQFPNGGLKGATHLKSVKLNEGAKKVLGAAFKECAALTDVFLPESITSFENDAFHTCTSLVGFNFPSHLDWIGGWVFNGCTSLTRVDLSNTKVWNVGQSAFSNCTNLKTIILGKNRDNLKINNFAFSKNMAIEHISIPSEVAIFPVNAFDGCDNLKQIDFHWSGSAIKAIENLTFPNKFRIDTQSEVKGVITVPAGEKANYEATTGWDIYSIVER